MKQFLWITLLCCFCLISAEESKSFKIALGAKKQIGITLTYDPAYVKLKYPNGDVPKDRGVCTDVVIRALRNASLDLQKLVHEDMKINFSKYPKNWGLKKTDKNIDHRRVPNLMVFFKRQGWSKKISKKSIDYQSGDIIAWQLPGGRLHVGILYKSSDKKDSTPYIIHNIGQGAKKENIIFSYKIIGHYRIK